MLSCVVCQTSITEQFVTVYNQINKYNLSTKHKKSKNVAVNFNPLSILNTDVTDNRQNCDANSRT